uniref:ZP domain-containing protein n=1 Tax=Caenorhabditis japonica TaxID=281687 RepID=A0A8R1E549_CAEJA
MARMRFYWTIFIFGLTKFIYAEPLITDKKVTCTSSNIEVTLTFAKSFSGGVLTENPRKYDQCRWKGNGSNSMSINIPLFNSTKCAVLANESTGTYSIKLLVSPVDGIIVDGFSAINVKCIYATQDITLTLPPIFNSSSALQITAMNDDNSVVTGSGGSPALTMQILEGHGIGGSPVVKAAVGQRITLDIALQNTGGLVKQCLREPITKIPLIPAHRRRRHDNNNATDVATLRLETVLEISPQSSLSASALVSSENYTHCYSQPALVATSALVCLTTALLVSLIHVVYRRWTKSVKPESINDNDSVDSSNLS